MADAEYQGRANQPGTGSGAQMQPGQMSNPSAPGANPNSPGAEPRTPQTVAEQEGVGARNHTARELSQLTGAAFDRRFLEIQVEHHQLSIERYQQMANSQQDSDLREFARDTLPTLQQHLQKAQSLQREVGASRRGQ